MGLFNFFKKDNRLETAVNLADLGVDMHSHFIPGIDDGATTIENSVEMISSMYEMGYKKVITTPHTMGDNYRNTPATILGGLEKVKLALIEKEIPIEIEAASEYYCDYDFEKKIDTEKLLTFGKKYLLFEVSYLNPPDNLYHVIFKLQLAGYKPILAHPERYNFWHNDFEKYVDFTDKGVLLQMNILSLTGHYGQSTKKIAEKMIDKNMISFIGSDCHHTGHIELMKKVVYEPYLKKLLDSKILLNLEL